MEKGDERLRRWKEKEEDEEEKGEGQRGAKIKSSRKSRRTII